MSAAAKNKELIALAKGEGLRFKSEKTEKNEATLALMATKDDEGVYDVEAALEVRGG